MSKETYKYSIIRKRMIEKKMSIQDLSVDLGMSYNALAGKLAGDTRLYLDEAIKICQILGLTLDEIASSLE